MKAITKAMAIILVMCMVIACVSVSVFAAGTKGSITIKNPTDSDASVANKDFELYRIFYATTDGQYTSYSWCGDSDQPNPFYNFFVQKGWVAAADSPAQYADIQIVVDRLNADYDSNIKLSEFAQELHTYIEANHIGNIDVIHADGSATYVTFDDLDLGYYMVYDSTELEGENVSMVRSAVMVDTVNKDIEITLKANRPQIDKTVLENDGVTYGEATSCEIGEVSKFKIETHIPSHMYYGEDYIFYIEDTLPQGLTLTSQDDIVVEIEGLADTTGYFDLEVTGNKYFKVQFTQKALYGADALAAGTNITIKYNTVVGDDIQRKANVNTAVLTYSNDPKVSTSIGSVSDNATIYSYAFVLSKFAIGSSGVSSVARLAGAEFEIYRYLGDDADGKPILSLMNFAEVENPKAPGKTMYIVGGDKTTLKVLDGTPLTNKVDNANYFGGNLGDITIFGLKEGTYYIKETKQPDGYIMPTDYFPITINDTIDENGYISEFTAIKGDHTGNGAIGGCGAYDVNLLVWMDIGNNPGDVLPSTGGMGTTLFTIIGVVMMAGAVAFFTSRKRSSVA